MDIEEALAKLTLEEKSALATGSDVWHTSPIERLGIPRLKLSDGPSGVRGEGRAVPSANFPCGTALAATWDVDLVNRIGRAMAQEARAKGAHIVLGPTVNIHRTPLAGRNFECYSEDPHLTARTAVAWITGLQSQGVGACVKHFAANDQEFERHSISSEVSERALREIYLPPFEAAVLEAKTWSIMGAYNRLNGTFCCEHEWLLSTLLKQEWGFDGIVVSDWLGAKSTAASANGGLDLEMPGPGVYFGERLVQAVRDGDVAEAVVDDIARRVLRTVERAQATIEEPEERAIDDPAHRGLARRVAADAFVLLKNDGVLPLSGGTIALIGPNAQDTQVQGGGSAQVVPHSEVGVLDALRQRVGERVRYEQGCNIHRGTPPLARRLVPSGIDVSFFANRDLEGEPVHVATLHGGGRLLWMGTPAPGVEAGQFSARCRGALVPDVSGTHCLSLSAVGRSRLYLDGELTIDNWEPRAGRAHFGLASAEVRADVDLVAGRAVQFEIEYRSRGAMIAGVTLGCLPPQPHDAIERAAALAAECDVAVVVLGTTSDWESEGFDRADMRLPGEQDELVRAVARANPRTIVVLNAGAPMDMPWIDDVAAVAQMWFAGEEAGNAVADVLLGDADPGGRLPTTIPLRLEDTPAFTNYPGERGQVFYGEGVFVGYRWYDARKIEPRFCFGHGLSYTTFDYADLVADTDRVEVTVTNTGTRAGSEVVQVYVRDVESTVTRPDKELKAFAKVRLNAGETERVALKLDRRALSFWDVTKNEWTCEPGEFEVLVGSSSRDIRASTRFSV